MTRPPRWSPMEATKELKARPAFVGGGGVDMGGEWNDHWKLEQSGTVGSCGIYH